MIAGINPEMNCALPEGADDWWFGAPPLDSDFIHISLVTAERRDCSTAVAGHNTGRIDVGWEE